MPPAGRGGAGNYEQSALAQKASPPERDIEAQSNSSAQASLTATAETKRKGGEPQTLAHSGRGGAGNWFSPDTLSKTGAFNNGLAAPAEVPPPSSSPPSITALFSGRGGAGNVRESATTAAATANREPDASAVEALLREGVQKAVEIELPKPEQAYLGGHKIDGR